MAVGIGGKTPASIPATIVADGLAHPVEDLGGDRVADPLELPLAETNQYSARTGASGSPGGPGRPGRRRRAGAAGPVVGVVLAQIRVAVGDFPVL